MKVSDLEWSTLVKALGNAPDSKTAKNFFEMWLDEKMAEVYQQAWLDCCKEYDIDDAKYEGYKVG